MTNSTKRRLAWRICAVLAAAAASGTLATGAASADSQVTPPAGITVPGDPAGPSAVLVGSLEGRNEVAAGAFLAAPALAATTFTVSPGGAWSGTRAAGSTIGIRDAVSNQVTLCSGLAVAGSFKSGKGLNGTNIGALTNIAFTGCKAEGVAVTVTVHTSTANPAPISLTGVFPPNSATFTGQATNVSLTLDDARGCHAVVGAKTINGGGPGFAGFTYRSTDARLSFAAGSHGLFVQSATPQCNSGKPGLDVQQFDRIDLGGFGNPTDSSAIISPAQKISSP